MKCFDRRAGVRAASFLDSIDRALRELTSIFAQTRQRMEDNTVTAADIDDFLSRLTTLAAREFVFRDHYLELATQMLEQLGRESDATTIRGLKTEPDLRFEFLQLK